MKMLLDTKTLDLESQSEQFTPFSRAWRNHQYNFKAVGGIEIDNEFTIGQLGTSY